VTMTKEEGNKLNLFLFISILKTNEFLPQMLLYSNTEVHLFEIFMSINLYFVNVDVDRGQRSEGCLKHIDSYYLLYSLSLWASETFLRAQFLWLKMHNNEEDNDDDDDDENVMCGCNLTLPFHNRRHYYCEEFSSKKKKFIASHQYDDHSML
jgi:hypothetical protein